MNINNLSNALGTFVKNDTEWLNINDSFKLCVTRMSIESQIYNAKQTEYLKDNPSTPKLFDDLFNAVATDETIKYLANVLIVDWKLKDNDSKEIEYTVDTAIEILNHPVLGKPLFTRIVNFTLNSANFDAKWEDKIVKN